jgi:hypothetical protein
VGGVDAVGVVKGLASLRVVDASIIPEVPSTSPTSPRSWSPSASTNASTGSTTEGEPMSNQQQLELDATLRHGHLDLEADVTTLRTGFNELMSRVPVAEDVEQTPMTIGGVHAIETSCAARAGPVPAG